MAAFRPNRGESAVGMPRFVFGRSRRTQPSISVLFCCSVWLNSTELKKTQTVTPARTRLVSATFGLVETSAMSGTSSTSWGTSGAGAEGDAVTTTAAAVVGAVVGVRVGVAGGAVVVVAVGVGEGVGEASPAGVTVVKLVVAAAEGIGVAGADVGPAGWGVAVGTGVGVAGACVAAAVTVTMTASESIWPMNGEFMCHWTGYVPGLVNVWDNCCAGNE